MQETMGPKSNEEIEENAKKRNRSSGDEVQPQSNTTASDGEPKKRLKKIERVIPATDSDVLSTVSSNDMGDDIPVEVYHDSVPAILRKMEPSSMDTNTWFQARIAAKNDDFYYTIDQKDTPPAIDEKEMPLAPVIDEKEMPPAPAIDDNEMPAQEKSLLTESLRDLCMDSLGLYLKLDVLCRELKIPIATPIMRSLRDLCIESLSFHAKLKILSCDLRNNSVGFTQEDLGGNICKELKQLHIESKSTKNTSMSKFISTIPRESRDCVSLENKADESAGVHKTQENVAEEGLNKPEEHKADESAGVNEQEEHKADEPAAVNEPEESSRNAKVNKAEDEDD